LNVPRAYASLDEILADPAVDVVHVTSPNHLHVPQASAILDAGKHVVCEKPLAMTAAESAGLVARADGSGLVNAVNFNIRFYPLHQHMREVLAAGGLGEVRFVTGHYFQDWLFHDTDWNWRLEPDKGGALRAVGDIGSHWLDLMAFVTGQPIVAVMADLATFVTARREPTGPVETFSTERSAETIARDMGTEDVAAILLRFANGARGTLAVSQISAGRKNSLKWEIDGSAGSAAWDSETPDHLWLGHRDRPNEILLRNPALMGEAGRAAAALPGGHVEGFGDTFAALFRAIYADVVAGGPSADPPYATFAQGHDEMLVNDAIAASASERRWVDVDRRSSSATPAGLSSPVGGRGDGRAAAAEGSR
jgi:predicted dehydrogenase